MLIRLYHEQLFRNKMQQPTVVINIQDRSTVAYLVNAEKHVVLLTLNKEKHRSQRFAIGLPTTWK